MATTTETHSGHVKTLKLDRGFGFIAASGQPDVFFNVNELDESLEWDEQLRERRVQFRIIGTGRGPKAVNVRAAD